MYEVIDTLSEQHKDQLYQLYQNEWWTKSRSRQDVDTIIAGSSFIIGIIHQEFGQLVGFTRILTDNFKYAHVYDVIVAPQHRGKGLGRMLLDRIINHPRLKDIKNIELTCAKDMAPFYERYDFSRDYGETLPMRRSNKTSGRN